MTEVAEYNFELCQQRHLEMERRMAAREAKEEKIFTVLDEMLKRLQAMEVKLASQGLWASAGKIAVGGVLGGVIAWILRNVMGS